MLGPQLWSNILYAMRVSREALVPCLLDVSGGDRGGVGCHLCA